MYSNHLKFGTDKVYEYISMCFQAILIHGCAPDDLLKSILIPIPKSLNKSLSDSDNYRAIALGSMLGKLYDLIILSKESASLITSELQFGFKHEFSTMGCTFVALENINHVNHLGVFKCICNKT